MSVERRDRRFDEIIDVEAQLEILGDGFQFTEGPIWHRHHQHLIFSDIPANRMYKWSEGDGVSVYRDPSNLANGNTYDHNQRVLTCEHGTSRVVRQEADGSVSVLASHYRGKELNSPNDIVVHSNGDIYFTDPTFGRGAGLGGLPRDLELDFRGVFRINMPSGDLELLSKDFSQPNGLAFSVDERILYVADTPEMHIRKFHLEADGALSGGEVFTVSSGTGAGAPDGLKVAATGHVFCAGPGGVHVYDPDDAECLGVILTPAFCANFTWGGVDLKSFFMTSSQHLYRIPLAVPGLPLF